jgi:hypothetical protein
VVDGRISKVLGPMMAVLGAFAIVLAMVSPAGASPDGHPPNGNGKGLVHNHASDDQSNPAPQGGDQGANQDCGAYCPSGVGLPSGNGNGDGNATGQPCAGCVGNADDKNPPGQFKDGSDHNNGYECDGNNGIGKTNPAHSGCSPTTDPSTTTTTVPRSTTTTVPHESTTTSSVPCANTTTTSAACATTTTVAGNTTTTVPTNVLGENFTRPSAQTSTGPLAFTGGSFARLFWAGVAILMLGVVVLGHRRLGARRA